MNGKGSAPRTYRGKEDAKRAREEYEASWDLIFGDKSLERAVAWLALEEMVGTVARHLKERGEASVIYGATVTLLED